jgi:hypothetical protein
MKVHPQSQDLIPVPVFQNKKAATAAFVRANNFDHFIAAVSFSLVPLWSILFVVVIKF